MEDIEYKYDNQTLTIVKCNRLLTNARVNKIFKKIGVVKKIIIQEGVDKIANHAFMYKTNIEFIELPESLTSIGEYAFAYCKSLKEIKIPTGVTYLAKGLFKGCESLESVSLSTNIHTMKEEVFSFCSSLKEIQLSNNIEAILTNTFFKCSSLEKVVFPSSLEKIGDYAFIGCKKLKEIDIPFNVTKIGECAFRWCGKLEKVSLKENIKTIGIRAFEGCKSLNKIEVPEGVEELSNAVFSICSSLKEIQLPKSLKCIKSDVFKDCKNLNKIKLSENIEKVSGNAFSDKYPFKLVLQTKKGDKEFNTKNIRFIANNLELLNIYDKETNKYGYYTKGEYIEFEKKDLFKKISKTNKINNLKEKHYVRLYVWNTKNKFLPNYKIIKNMPIEDIDLFYINNNCNKWRDIISTEDENIKENEDILFKVCYILGLFQKNGNKSDKAFDYIKEHLIKDGKWLYVKEQFSTLDITKGFDLKWAEFFMKYYKDNNDFMVDETTTKDFLVESYQQFDTVKLYYPNKFINTNRKVDVLLPEHVISVLKSKNYEKVKDENIDLAILVGKYGYTQDQFEELQQWYDVAKLITEEELKIFIEKDIEEDDEITYELLDKSNPLTAVLGNITNCCQVIGEAGESCVKYGMVMPNSKFMTFSYNKEIIGQAWVWYDEKTETVCLDDIEIPINILDNITRNKTFENKFVECLSRMASNFVKEMENHGLNVRQVTVGKGFNSLSEIYDKIYEEIESTELSDYNRYTDSEVQYVIKKR